MIISSIVESMKCLVWVSVLLPMILYFFSLCFTMAATGHLRSQAIDHELLSEEDLEVEVLYGTVARSLYSCLQAMLDGGSWGMLMDVLIRVHWPYAAIFLAFVLFSVLVLLNTVTGAFVNAAIEKSAH